MLKSYSFTIIAALLCLVLSACATNRQKRWTATGVAFVGGLGIGAASAPANERKELHAVYWGSLLGLATALI